MKIYISFFLSLLFLSGCTLGGSDGNSSYSNVVTVSNTLLPSSTSGTQTYLLLTNPTSSSQPIPYITVNGESSRALTEVADNENTVESDSFDYPHKIDIQFSIPEKNASSPTRNTITTDYSGKVVGSTTDFYVLYNGTPTLPSAPDKDATQEEITEYNQALKNYQYNLDGYDLKEFELKSKTSIENDTILYIWSDTADTSDEAIDYLSDNFATIFPEMISMFGDHWGDTNYSNLITSEDVHIILTDIFDDKNSSSDGIIFGYFDSNNTITDYDYSNKCLNVAIDSYYYINGYEGNENYSWSETNYGTAAAISTLIHEFQHLIHFYNKNVTYGCDQEYFVNEMFSMVAEEIFSSDYAAFTYNGTDYIASPDHDRLPFFNMFWDLNSNFYWDSSESFNNLNSYSMAYTIGTYLLRNYGFDLFREYMTSSYTGKDGIINALNTIDTSETHTTTTLLKNFGTAILSSSFDQDSMESPFMFNNEVSLNIDSNTFTLLPLDVFDTKTYKCTLYNDYFTYENRLFTTSLLSQGKPEGRYYVSFQNLELAELNSNSQTDNSNFLPESNIYVDLGDISSSDTINIEFYGDQNVEYSFIYE